MSKTTRKLFLFLTMIALFIVLIPVHAQIGGAINQQTNAFAGAGGANLAQAQDPRIVAARIISIILTVVGTLFLAYTVYAGYLILTSAGDEEKVTKGKNTIRTAIIGVLVTLSAYGIMQFVTTGLLEAQKDQSGFSNTQGIDTGSSDYRQYYDRHNDPLAAPPYENGTGLFGQ